MMTQEEVLAYVQRIDEWLRSLPLSQNMPKDDVVNILLDLRSEMRSHL